MKAIVIHKFGSPEEFEIAEIAQPRPEAGEVLIKVAATSVNPIDTKIRSGVVAAVAPDFPAVLHGDVAGVVELHVLLLAGERGQVADLRRLGESAILLRAHRDDTVSGLSRSVEATQQDNGPRTGQGADVFGQTGTDVPEVVGPAEDLIQEVACRYLVGCLSLPSGFRFLVRHAAPAL